MVTESRSVVALGLREYGGAADRERKPLGMTDMFIILIAFMVLCLHICQTCAVYCLSIMSP